MKATRITILCKDSAVTGVKLRSRLASSHRSPNLSFPASISHRSEEIIKKGTCSEWMVHFNCCHHLRQIKESLPPSYMKTDAMYNAMQTAFISKPLKTYISRYVCKLLIYIYVYIVIVCSKIMFWLLCSSRFFWQCKCKSLSYVLVSQF